MKYALVVLALALLLCSASMAAVTPPYGGWGHFNGLDALSSGAYSSLGYVYDPVTYTWEMGTESGQPAGFTVTADVEMWCDMYFDATDIYFHIGKDLGPDPKISATVNGWLNSNNGQWLFVSKPSFQPTPVGITTLQFKNNIFGGQSPNNQPPNPNAPAIPIKWYLTDSGAEREGVYSTGGNNSQLYGVTWLLDQGLAGYHPFNIRCEIRPDRYQPDGDYEMDPILVSSPVL